MIVLEFVRDELRIYLADIPENRLPYVNVKGESWKFNRICVGDPELSKQDEPEPTDSHMTPAEISELVAQAWQAVSTSRGTLFLDMHEEYAMPEIVAAVGRAVGRGMTKSEIVDRGIYAAFNAHESRLEDAVRDSINVAQAKALQYAHDRVKPRPKSKSRPKPNG